MSKTKVLYAEDELFLGKIVRESLESRGFEVMMEGDGAKVLPLFKTSKPDICILDIMLPNKDGFAIADEIRELDEEVPVIFLTAKTQTDDVVKGFSLGGNDYIRKPFSMEELIVRMQHLLQFTRPGKTSEAPANEPIPIGRYTFLPWKYELHCESENRKLSHRETELLRILSDNRHQVVNRRDILLQIWGDDSFFNSRNLDVYITKLRDYLKADSSIEIVTIKGVGYHFVIG